VPTSTLPRRNSAADACTKLTVASATHVSIPNQHNLIADGVRLNSSGKHLVASRV
jgi:hypothetical protein